MPNIETAPNVLYTLRKIEQELNVKETKSPIVNQSCAVYGFQCDLCDVGYVGYTCGHLHNRVKGHKQQSSANHYKNMHRTMPQGLLKHFEVLKKYRIKFGCLVHVWNAFYKSFKAKSQSAIRLHWCKSISIIFAPSYGDSLRQNHFKDICTHCYCTSLVPTLYMTRHVFQACAPSRNSTKYTADDLCSNLICKYFCWMLGDPHFFFRQITSFSVCGKF